MTIRPPIPEIQSDLKNSRSKVKIKGQGQRYPSQHNIQLTHFLFVSHQLDQPFLRYGKYNVQLQKTDLKFYAKKSLKKILAEFLQNLTRTTRMPAFWGYSLPPHDYPYHWVILDPKSKEDKVKVTNFKNSNFWILKRALQATHLLKLLDKMCKYEMDPMSIVEDTERTRFCPQTDRRTDGQTDGRTDKVIPVYPPINFVEAGGIIRWKAW